MVYRWRCRNCNYTVWSGKEEATVNEVKSHLLNHYKSALSKNDFRIQWRCPYCEKEEDSYEKKKGITSFQNHLFTHVKPLLESSVNLADDIDNTGDVLIRGPVEGKGANNARTHFLSAGDIVFLVTTNPAKRLRLLQEKLQSWPAWTIILTTVDNPLNGVGDIDFSTVPLEIVKFDKRNGLGELGETISRIIEDQDTTNGKISFEFDILPDIIGTFDLQRVFRFLHILSARLEKADALSHYYINPQIVQEATINVIEEVFDMVVTADGSVFLSSSK